MKNRFNIAILLFAVALAGCAKVEVVPTAERAVTFQVGSYAPQTKAEGDTVSLNGIGINDFSSFAYLHAAGFMDTPRAFFGEDGETISFNGTDEWAPSHDYFWPKTSESYINFISWRGGDPSIDYAQNNEDKWVATFAWENFTVATADTLLLVADMAWRYSANVNPATYQAYNGVTEGVPTLMHHALAQICFLGRTAIDPVTGVSWEVSVNKIELGGVYNTGSIYMTNTDPGSTKPQAWTIEDDGWVVDSDGGEATIGKDFGDNPKLLSSTADTLLKWQSVIPQIIKRGNDDEMLLDLTYTVATTYGTAPNTTVVEETVTAQVPLAAFNFGSNSTLDAWGMGQRITYTIAINPDTGVITIIPVETNWVVNDEYPINIE